MPRRSGFANSLMAILDPDDYIARNYSAAQSNDTPWINDEPWLAQPTVQSQSNNISNPQGEQFYQDSNGNWQMGTPPSNNNNNNSSNEAITVTAPDGSWYDSNGNSGGPSNNNNNNNNNNYGGGYNYTPPPPAYDYAAAEERAREEEARRLRQQREASLQGQLGALSGSIGGLTINDEAQLRAMLSQLGSLQGQADGYGINMGGISSLRNQVNSLLSQRKAEMDRWNALTGAFNQAAGGIGSMGVRDYASGGAGAEADLMAAYNALMGFSSDLNVNRNQYGGQYQGAMGSLNRLEDEFNRQTGMIDQARGGYEDFLQGFGSAINRADYRSSYELDAFNDTLDRILNNQVDGVELDVNFSDMFGAANDARGSLDKLYDRRRGDLEEMGIDADELLGAISAAELESAQQVRGFGEQFNELDSNLFAYGVGDLVSGVGDTLFEADSALEDLYGQLTDRQQLIEDDALATLEGAREGSFTRLADLDDLISERDALDRRRDTFEAVGANDEIAMLDNLLSDERERLMREQALRLQRQARSRANYAGDVRIGQEMGQGYMSPDQYNAYLRALSLGQGDPFYSQISSGFSRQLGLI